MCLRKVHDDWTIEKLHVVRSFIPYVLFSIGVPDFDELLERECADGVGIPPDGILEVAFIFELGDLLVGVGVEKHA